MTAHNTSEVLEVQGLEDIINMEGRDCVTNGRQINFFVERVQRVLSRSGTAVRDYPEGAGDGS